MAGVLTNMSTLCTCTCTYTLLCTAVHKFGTQIYHHLNVVSGQNKVCECPLSVNEIMLIWLFPQLTAAAILALVFTSPRTHIGGRRNYFSGYWGWGRRLTSAWAILCALAERFDNVCNPVWGHSTSDQRIFGHFCDDPLRFVLNLARL